MFARRSLLLLVLAAACWSPLAGSAELAADKKEKLVAIDASLQKAVQLYREKKFDDLKKLVGEIDISISSFQVANEGDAAVEPILAPFKARLHAARKLAEHGPTQLAANTPKPRPSGSKPAAMPAGTTPPPATAGAPAGQAVKPNRSPPAK